MDKVRIGIVGVGMMGREHIRNLKLLPDAKVVAIADPVQSSIDHTLRTLGEAGAGVVCHDSAAALAAAGGVDAVIVVSPNFTHRAVLDSLLQAELHILCEKPLCTTLEDARWAATQAQASDKVFWTAMEYRFMPPVADLIGRVHGGEAGRLAMLSIREHRFPFLTKVGDWNRFNRNTGGTMVEKCCHFFDLMRLIVRSEPVRVFCSGAMDVNHLDERYDGQRPDIIDNSFTVVDFENGARAMLELSMFAEGSEEQEAVVCIGDVAKIETTIPTGDVIVSPRVPLGAPKQPLRSHVAVDEAVLAAGTHHGSVYFQLRAFLDAVKGQGPVLVSADDGLRSVAMGIAAETSARERRVVTMAELGF